MSGGNVPYHLRQNKAIDRNIFADLLVRLTRYVDLIDYTYIGFGGPFMEDFKLMHSYVGIKKMISIEENSKVLARQKFNKPLSNIDCELKSSSDFITDYEFEGGTIIWLDYASSRQLGSQFDEFHQLLTKLHPLDIVKITLNANANSLGDAQAATAAGLPLNEVRLNKLKSRIGRHLPSDIAEEQMHGDKYPGVLSQALLLTADRAMAGKPGYYFQPLASFAYADTHKMLTFTGIILPSGNAEIRSFYKRTGLRRWSHAIPRDTRPRSIVVPELSIRERLYIDSMLPKKRAKTIHKRLGFLLGRDETESLNGVEDYVRYYREYPYFSKILP
jgi:hypothetical protein